MGDPDVTNSLFVMGRRKPGLTDEHISTSAEEIFFNFQDAIGALQAVTGDHFLSNLVTPENPMGALIYKEATGETGVSLSHLSHFAATHMRMRSIDAFIRSTYPNAILREWQDLKARYEISADGLRIAHIFEVVERNRGVLKVVDYSVSQTSLEQVFNHHAKEAADALSRSR